MVLCLGLRVWGLGFRVFFVQGPFSVRIRREGVGFRFSNLMHGFVRS